MATSLDGYIDDTGPHRLVLSDADDLDWVDEVQAGLTPAWSGRTLSAGDDPGCWCARRAVKLHPADPQRGDPAQYALTLEADRVITRFITRPCHAAIGAELLARARAGLPVLDDGQAR